MATVNGGVVRPHVQAFADACQQATGAPSYGTYPGHQPTIDRALDIFTPTSSRTLGDAICAFAIDHLAWFGVDYIIYRQHIYNPEIATYWRLMEDRGSPTANHMDHVHVSFEPTGAVTPPGPQPAPQPQPEDEGDEGMRLIWHKGAVYAVDVAGRSPWGLQPVAVDALKATGLKVGGNPDDDQTDLLAQFGHTG